MRRSGPFATLGLAVLLSMGSAYLLFTSPEMRCERRAPLTVLATLAAFLIALGFRQLATAQRVADRRILLVCMLISAIALFADVRFVLKYRLICNQIQEQIQQLNHPGP
jgi:hypothetical protein